MSVLIETSLGDIVIDLLVDECPKTCLNFLKLCKIKYYHGCLFHFIQKDFIVQTGDPSGSGKGGDSIYGILYGESRRFFEDEIHRNIKHNKIGTVSMASAGQNMNCSQFYITTSKYPLEYLDEKHTIFGSIEEGMDVLMQINESFCDENNRPYQNIRIKHTHILDDPFPDPENLPIPDMSPAPIVDRYDIERIRDDEEIDDNKDRTEEEIHKAVEDREAKSRAEVLEMIGDIPDSEIKPPDNVIFVCKLNPLTTSEDLEIIFGRFGSIIECEVIRDYKSGDSLQYAFITFEEKKQAEEAYFKMDGVLIDDRRIKVDFSQSVAKCWGDYRRNKLKTSAPNTKDLDNNIVSKNLQLKSAISSGDSKYDMLISEHDIDSSLLKSKKHSSSQKEQSDSRKRSRHEHKHHSEKHRKHNNYDKHYKKHRHRHH